MEYTVSDRLKFLFSVPCSFYCAEPLVTSVTCVHYYNLSYNLLGTEIVDNNTYYISNALDTGRKVRNVNQLYVIEHLIGSGDTQVYTPANRDHVHAV